MGGNQNGDNGTVAIWLPKVLVTALVSFVIAGIGGAYLDRYMSRARPSVAITSVGFQVPEEEFIELPAEVIEASKESLWDRPLTNFETIGYLQQREEGARQTIEALVIAGRDTDSWIDRVGLLGVSPEALPEVILEDYPYFSHSEMGAILNGEVATGELTDGPVALSEVKKLSLVGRIAKISEGWDVGIGAKGGLFRLRNNYTAEQKAKVELLAESAARGVTENLLHYARYFQTQANQERLALDGLSKKLRNLLLESSFLSVKSAIFNRGGESVTFGPFFGLRLMKGVGEPAVLLLAIAAEDESAEQERRVMSMMRKIDPTLGNAAQRGQKVKVDPYLPESGTSTYITVPPGESLEVSLLSVEALGANAGSIKDLFSAGGLACELVGRTLGGKSCMSALTLFGEDLAEAEKEKFVNELSD